MSWDVVLFNSGEKITAVEDLDATKLLPADFCGILESHFEKIVKDKNHRSIKGDGFEIEYFVDTEPCSNTILNLYGEAAIYPLIELAIKHNWQIFDTGMGEMIDLTRPQKNGFKKFMAYLSQILKK